MGTVNQLSQLGFTPNQAKHLGVDSPNFGILPISNGGTGVSSLTPASYNVIGVVNAGSISAEVLEVVNYLQIGKIVFLSIVYVWTQATASAQNITINLPVQPSVINQPLTCLMNATGSTQPLPAICYINSTTSLGTAICYPTDLGNITVGNRSIQIQGFYYSS